MDASPGFRVEPGAVSAVQRAGNRKGLGGAMRGPISAWLVVLVAVVGVAAAGRVIAPPVTPPIAQDVSAGAVPAIPIGDPSPTVEIIVLTSPAAANAVVTTRELTIRGFLAAGFGTIRVTLEARGNRIIDVATIKPPPVVAGGPATDRRFEFETRFGLPNPRPNGRMIVQVALLDGDGRIVDVVRRPFRVGPLLEDAGG